MAVRQFAPLLPLVSFLVLTSCSDRAPDAQPTQPAPVAVPSVDAGAPPAPDAADASDASASPYKTLEDLPDCDREQPSLACIEQLFLPLKTATFPFDADKVARALGTNAVAVAPGWDLTAHHVLEADLQIGVYGCFFGEYRYAKELVPFSGPGCGEMLVAGGHPHAIACKEKSTPMGNCVDEVPPSESFDLVVASRPARERTLDLAEAMPVAGEEVFTVGYPAFAWLTEAERAGLAPRYPLVSYGRVLAADGRGVVASTAAYAGNSGGPMVNTRGEVVGVLSTKVGHLRARGTTMPAPLLDHHAVAVVPDASTRAIVKAAAGK